MTHPVPTVNRTLFQFSPGAGNQVHGAVGRGLNGNSGHNRRIRGLLVVQWAFHSWKQSS